MGGIVGSKLDPDNVDLRHFRMERVLGAGGFGNVHAAVKKTQPGKGEFFAIKELKKLTIIEKKAHKEVFDELNMLSTLDYPLVCNAHYAFQDERNLFLVMDLALGGDLRYRLNQIRKEKGKEAAVFMSEDEIRFDMYCVLLALRYVHGLSIVFRDLKPDNVLIKDNGFILLTDFGISKHCKDGICKTRSGTHGYMAPEVYRGKGEHSFNSDMFAFGVMMHELLKGSRPFKPALIQDLKLDVNKEEQTRTINIPGAKIKKEGIVSDDMVDLLTKCLQFDPALRISSGDAMDHPWFKDFKKEDFETFKATPLFLPNVTVANCDSTDLEVQEMFQDKSALPKPEPKDQEAFADYKYDINKSGRKRASQVFA